MTVYVDTSLLRSLIATNSMRLQGRGYDWSRAARGLHNYVTLRLMP